MILLISFPMPFLVRKPRASGVDPAQGEKVPLWSWVNPARAGMILGEVGGARPPRGKPRASGDDPRRSPGTAALQE